MDQKLKNYSSGMQVRLAFACATKAKAEVLLVDEVLAVGDSDFQRKCFNYFKLLKKEKKTVVFVSHDMGAVREYCDRAVLIDSNHIIAEGSADDVATEYTKLFNSPQSISGNDNNNANRWGDGKIKFEKVEAKVNDKNLILTADAKVYGQVEDVVFGYLIKDSAGNPLFGSNSHVKNIKTGVFSPGDTKKITWTIPNIFDDGIFVITLAISQNDGVSQHDWWEDAASFTVFKENKTPYALDPPSTITVS
jgi:ABC-type multidrug transport system ATPase subunit